MRSCQHDGLELGYLIALAVAAVAVSVAAIAVAVEQLLLQPVVIEPDLATYSMVHLHTRVFAVHYMGHFHPLSTGLVQPVVATYSMRQMLLQPVVAVA